MLSAILIDAGWLGPGLQTVFAPGAEELLTALGRAWESEPETGRGDKRCASMLEWLGSCRTAGAALTADQVLRKRTLVETGRSERLVGWSCGIPSGRRIAIVSSRTGRRLNEAWYAALRHCCRRLDPALDVLLTSVGTASAEAVDCAADLFGLRRLRIIPPGDRDSVADWLRRLRRKWPAAMAAPAQFEAWLSPPLAIDDRREISREENIPLRDRALFDACDEVFVLSMRKGGTSSELSDAA